MATYDCYCDGFPTAATTSYVISFAGVGSNYYSDSCPLCAAVQAECEYLQWLRDRQQKIGNLFRRAVKSALIICKRFHLRIAPHDRQRYQQRDGRWIIKRRSL